MRVVPLTFVTFVVAFRTLACMSTVPGDGAARHDRPTTPPTTRPTALTVSAARDIVARLDARPTRPCAARCGGAKNTTRLRFEEERDYRLVLIAKAMGPHDQFRVSSLNRETVALFIENADLGEVLSLRGEDGLKVCSQFQMATTDCEWDCTFDAATGVVKMHSQGLSADFALFCY